MAHGQPDFSPTAVDVVLRPEWAAKEGTDKTFNTIGTNLAASGSAYTSYKVPAGKKLYICGASLHAYAYSAVDGDLHQTCGGLIYNASEGADIIRFGGDGGASVGLLKPVVIEADITVRFYVYNFSAHTSSLAMTAWGYEI